jgi:hypothetical protein
MSSLALPKHLLCFFINHCAGDFRLDTKLPLFNYCQMANNILQRSFLQERNVKLTWSSHFRDTNLWLVILFYQILQYQPSEKSCIGCFPHSKFMRVPGNQQSIRSLLAIEVHTCSTLQPSFDMGQSALLAVRCSPVLTKCTTGRWSASGLLLSSKAHQKDTIALQHKQTQPLSDYLQRLLHTRPSCCLAQKNIRSDYGIQSTMSIESAIYRGCRRSATRRADHGREAAATVHACERGAVAGPTASTNKKNIITSKSKN